MNDINKTDLGSDFLTPNNFYETDDGAFLYYEVHGEGTPLILLHGWTASMRVFDKNVPELSKHYQVITVDYRGAGYSSKLLEGHTPDRYCRDIRGLVEHLGLKEYFMGGWSMSVAISLRYVELFGEVLRESVADHAEGVQVVFVGGDPSRRRQGVGCGLFGERNRIFEIADFRIRGGVDFPPRVCHFHIALSSENPDFADEHVVERNGGCHRSAGDDDRVGTACLH